MSLTAVASGGIGAPVMRKEDDRLLRGQGRYTHNVQIAGAVHLAIVRSPHAHARIGTIDTAAARAMPGVLAVVTAADLERAGVQTIPCYSTIAGLVDLLLANRDGSPRRATRLPLLANDRARFVGDAVAAVVAATREQAQDAAERVLVDYEPLPAVTQAVAATAITAPRLWDEIDHNLCIDAQFGDSAATDAAFQRADHVVHFTSQVQRVTGVMMETRATVAEYDAATGYTIHCGGDNSLRQRDDLAVILGEPKERVRVIAGDVGGNYGTRNWTYPEYGITAWLAKSLDRPVIWRATRSESFLADFQGRDLAVDASLALDRSGKFLGLRATLTSNVGAYTVSFVPINKTGELLTSVYAFDAASVQCLAVLTNTPPTAPYRSAGRPEAMYIIERLIDLAAAQCGFDPIELRQRNLITAAQMPFRTALGLEYDSGDFPEAMRRALAIGDWRSFPARRDEAKQRGRRRGIGFANYIEITSGFPVEQSEITVHAEGWVDVVIGTTSSGQGHETSFAQCVATWLGVPHDCIRLIAGDTAVVKVGGGSHSARSMRMAGIVMGRASEAIIERGAEIAGHLLEAARADIEFLDGRFVLTGTDRSIGIFEVAQAAAQRADLPERLRGALAATSLYKMEKPGFPYGAQVCEVELDPATGAIEIIRYAAVDDVGRAINPLILHGQTHGGIVQGAGQALFEHSHYDPVSGQLLAGTFMDYAIGRADHFPSFDTDIMEVPTPTNPLGVRGGGEGGTTPALGVVINAIVDACREYGVRHIEMPATSERVWRAITA